MNLFPNVVMSMFFKCRCMNGGTCIDGVDSFACSCPPEATGILCHCKTSGDQACQAFPYWFQNRTFRPLITHFSESPHTRWTSALVPTEPIDVQYIESNIVAWSASVTSTSRKYYPTATMKVSTALPNSTFDSVLIATSLISAKIDVSSVVTDRVVSTKVLSQDLPMKTSTVELPVTIPPTLESSFLDVSSTIFSYPTETTTKDVPVDTTMKLDTKLFPPSDYVSSLQLDAPYTKTALAPTILVAPTASVPRYTTPDIDYFSIAFTTPSKTVKPSDLWPDSSTPYDSTVVMTVGNSTIIQTIKPTSVKSLQTIPLAPTVSITDSSRFIAVGVSPTTTSTTVVTPPTTSTLLPPLAVPTTDPSAEATTGSIEGEISTTPDYSSTVSYTALTTDTESGTASPIGAHVATEDTSVDSITTTEGVISDVPQVSITTGVTTYTQDTTRDIDIQSTITSLAELSSTTEGDVTTVGYRATTADTDTTSDEVEVSIEDSTSLIPYDSADVTPITYLPDGTEITHITIESTEITRNMTLEPESLVTRETLGLVTPTDASFTDDISGATDGIEYTSSSTVDVSLTAHFSVTSPSSLVTTADMMSHCIRINQLKTLHFLMAALHLYIRYQVFQMV